MAFLKKSIIFLAVFIASDRVIQWLYSKFGDSEYYGIFEMWKEYSVHQQDLKDVVFNVMTLFLIIPLWVTLTVMVFLPKLKI